MRKRQKKPKRYDAAMRGIFDLHFEDWLERFGIPKGTPVKVLDSDVSSVTARADKVLLISAVVPFILHIECQVSYDPGLIRRMLRYNALLHELHNMPVVSVLILLRRKANGRNYSGQLQYSVEGHSGSIEFCYQIMRVWELDADDLLASGPGLQALSLLSDMAAKNPRETVLKLARSLAHRKDWKRIKEWSFSLAAMRYNRAQLEAMFKGVDEMLTFDDVLEVSSVKSLIINHAKKKALEKGRKEGLKQGIEHGRQSLIRIGTILFGVPTPAQRRRIMGIDDFSVLNDLEVQAKNTSNWKELLAAVK